MKQKQKQRAKMEPLPREVCGKIDGYNRAAASEARLAVLRNDHILVFGEVFQTLLTSWNSFNVCFVIFCCTWLSIPKAHATPTNSNVRVLPVGSKVIEHGLLYRFVFS